MSFQLTYLIFQIANLSFELTYALIPFLELVGQLTNDLALFAFSMSKMSDLNFHGTKRTRTVRPRITPSIVHVEDDLGHNDETP